MMNSRFIKAASRTCSNICPPKFIDEKPVRPSRKLCSPPSYKYFGKKVVTIIPDIKKKWKGPKPLNPCARSLYPKDSWQKYRSIVVFLCFPLIILLMYRQINYIKPHKREEFCREYEYMNRRTKRFPWGEGQKSLFHGDKNFLPSECIPVNDNEDD